MINICFLFIFDFICGIRPVKFPGGGYLVERWVRGCAAQIGCFSASQVYQWPLFYLKIVLDIGRVFANCILFDEFFL